MYRFSLRDFLLIFAVGVALAAYRYFWQPPPNPNTRPHLAAYLAILATATLGAFQGRPVWRRACQDFARFGWLNLVFVMWGGFWLSTIYDSERVVQGSHLGVVFGILCGLFAAWLVEPSAGGQAPNGA